MNTVNNPGQIEQDFQDLPATRSQASSLKFR